MLLALVAGALLGLSLAAPPGPMNALIANQAAHHGWLRAVRLGSAAPLADTLYLIVFALGIGPLVAQQTVLLQILAALGAVLMARLAWQAWHAKDAQAPRYGFPKAFLVAATNPYQLTWWLTAGLVFMHDQGAWGVAGFISSIFAWVAIFAWLVVLGARRWRWFTPVVRVASSLVLALFAVVMAAFAMGAKLL